ncbi:unnamed protein product [Rotaria magnacalcarata]|uniref:Pyridoxal-dependent decarboxylase domain-containing protein 1 n=1 Tax=Rotaria magnacalcarata TaxID=392030 RepID=A0A816PAS2_9BILA|nr:unnamed protein product [Rotaria magnacalcarata]CAF2153462.1 unnamed protein product [Rotaria magnacalcarata]
MNDKTEHNINGITDSSARLKSSSGKGLITANSIHDDANYEADDSYSNQLAELNNQTKNDFISYCLSFLQDDEEARECAQVVWNKYLQCVGDVAMISAFFDTLPFNIKASVLQKYQNEIIEWCRKLFHINCETLLYSTFYSEAFLRIIRCALKQVLHDNDLSIKKAIIYVSIDFDENLKSDLLSSISNIKFEHIQNDLTHEDMIDVQKLEESIKQDLNDAHSYPFMVIANIGTTLLGRCDDLIKIKQICNQHNIWLHAIGDLLGSLMLLSTIKENVNFSCDSLTIDIVKLFGIQNLPYVTFLIRSINDKKQDKQIDFNSTQDEQLNTDNLSTKSTASTNISSSPSTTTVLNINNVSMSHSFDDVILHSPSISFLSIWSISQRCSNNDVLHHMKRSFELSNVLMKNLKQIKTLKILTDDDNQGIFTYKRICSGDASDEPLPKTVVIFRFQTTDIPNIEDFDALYNYIDLLNLWLFDKLSQQYPKMNLELLKGIHFQMLQPADNSSERMSAHAIRFAPLEHLVDIVDDLYIQAFTDDVQRYSDILLATMAARVRLPSSVANYENIVSISVPNWAGIGAIRYIPSHIDIQEQSELSTYDINTIQAELARKLQVNDSAFSLGGGTNEHDSMFYLRLGMIRKCDDLDVLLQKIADSGKETETSLKYVEDMAEKIKMGIEKVQKDLKNENQQILAQEGLLRQLPVISNIISWWSPPPATTSLTTKGRSFDLNSGCVESTEDTYVYRMQIKKQSPHALTHNDDEEATSVTNTDTTTNSTDNISEKNHNQ